MPEKSWNQAIHETLDAAFQADSGACLFLAQGLDDRSGADALIESCGEQRVRFAPASPSGLVGIAAGAARAGVRAVVELHEDAAITQAVNHLADHVATACRDNGAGQQMPLLIRAVVEQQDTFSDEVSATALAGLRAVVPSNPRDAVALVRSGLQSDGPLLLLEPLSLLHAAGEVPEQEELLPIGEAAVLQRGSDVTVVAAGTNVRVALEAAELLRVESLEAEVIDIRTVAPLDLPTIFESVHKTGRVVIADTAGSVGGWGAELASQLAEHAFDSLDAPIRRRSGKASLEHPQLGAELLAQAIRQLAAE